ncbi:S8 family peptidase [Domibacillus indicus]|uniref:S8 family peptidase n=1 Tax=Domibacillus indicus TaxID=1437523 RepID=UPI000697DC5D|nr:S8 family serine peptidase [Domibacillus indicus]
MTIIKHGLFCIAVLFFIACTPSISLANTETGEPAVILFDQTVDSGLLEQHTQSIDHFYESIPAAVVNVTEEQKQLLADSPNVNSIEYDTKVESSAQKIPYSYKLVGAEKRIPSSLTGKGVKIGILDSGIDTTHPDLKGRVAGGVCLMKDLDPSACISGYNDDFGHGTHVAGIIAANNNSIGTVGIAPNATLYSIKVLDSRGLGTTSTMLKGIDYSIQNKLDILNISITTPDHDSALKAMLTKAYDAGILIVAAAGNNGPPAAASGSTVQFPAKYDSVIGVSSIDAAKNIDPLSAAGKEVELAAPGVGIYSTYPLDISLSGYEESTGTSMAAPYVASMAALYIEKYPEMTNVQIRKLLQSNASDLGAAGRDSIFGYGLVQPDLYSAAGEAKLPYTTDGRGKITFNTAQLLEKGESYDVYRGEERIKKGATAAQFTDYASKGSISYHFYPVKSGAAADRPLSMPVVANAGPVLSDLSSSIWYNRFIVYLYHEKILQGYQNNEIRPTSKITRGEAAILIGKALGYDGTPRATRFADVTDQVLASGYIEQLAKNGIITGFSDKTFHPYDEVSRAEMAILVAKAYKVETSTVSTLKDISTNVTGYQYINGMLNAKIVSGFADNTFRPGAKITRAEFAKFLSLTINKEMR